MRRIARWSATIAVAVLTVLAAGILAAGATVIDPAPVAASDSPHQCHGAPLHDAQHPAAGPARGGAAVTPDAEPALITVCAPPAVTSSAATIAPDRGPPPGLRTSTADLQVFRI